jgi:hypothetical protein
MSERPQNPNPINNTLQIIEAVQPFRRRKDANVSLTSGDIHAVR